MPSIGTHDPALSGKLFLTDESQRFHNNRSAPRRVSAAARHFLKNDAAAHLGEVVAIFEASRLQRT